MLRLVQESADIEERWSPVAVLTWIVTRSKRFVAELDGLGFATADARLWQLQSKNHSPDRMTLANALFAFRQELESGSIRPCERPGSLATDGMLLVAKIDELALMDISFRAEEVQQIWPRWPAARAWAMANAYPWQPPRGSAKLCIRSLSVGEYIPFAEAADVLAFGQTKMAVGLSDLEERAALLRAGLAITRAAAEGQVMLIGVSCERLPAAPHLLRKTGPRIAIGPEVLGDLAPVPYGGRDWLGPRHFAESYAECGHAPQSVRFYEVRIERTSLARWLSALSTKAPGLSEAEVKNLILSEKAKDASIGIGTIEQMVKAKDPLFPRQAVRRFAREIGVEGKRGRRRKNSAG